MDTFAVLTDSADKDQPNKILIYDRKENRIIREIMNPNPNPQFLGLRLLPTIKETPLLLVRDSEYVSMVDVTSGTHVNLISSPLDMEIRSAFYLDVREEDGIYQIFTIEHVKG